MLEKTATLGCLLHSTVVNWERERNRHQSVMDEVYQNRSFLATMIEVLEGKLMSENQFVSRQPSFSAPCAATCRLGGQISSLQAPPFS